MKLDELSEERSWGEVLFVPGGYVCCFVDDGRRGMKEGLNRCARMEAAEQD